MRVEFVVCRAETEVITVAQAYPDGTPEQQLAQDARQYLVTHGGDTVYIYKLVTPRQGDVEVIQSA